jgi:hypothetical protein
VHGTLAALETQRRLHSRPVVIALAIACLIALAVAWHFTAKTPQVAGLPLEIRWHGNGIVLQGAVRDVATQRALTEGAAVRLGGETDQVVDWLDIVPSALPVADAAALAELIRLGQEGWHLQRRPKDGWLAVQSLSDDRSTRARITVAQRVRPRGFDGAGGASLSPCAVEGWSRRRHVAWPACAAFQYGGEDPCMHR